MIRNLHTLATLSLVLCSILLISGCGGGSSSAPTATQALRVACIGDSITFGEGTSNRSLYSYPAVLARLLGSRYSVSNFGVSGATVIKSRSSSYFKQIQFRQALSSKPDIIVILLGTNDSGQDTDQQLASEFQNDYQALIDNFRAKNSNLKVYACLPSPIFPTSRNARLTGKVIPLILQAAERRNAVTINLQNPSLDNPKLFPDSVHPNDEGAALIASLIQKGLEE